ARLARGGPRQCLGPSRSFSGRLRQYGDSASWSDVVLAQVGPQCLQRSLGVAVKGGAADAGEGQAAALQHPLTRELTLEGVIAGPLVAVALYGQPAAPTLHHQVDPVAGHLVLWDDPEAPVLKTEENLRPPP